MGIRRARAYWPTRIMLTLAIVSLPAVLLWCDAMQQGMIGPLATPNLALDPMGVWMAAVAGLWFAGVIWMLHIFRGPRDEPPPWRYRVR